MVSTREQDFADRWYQFFGGRKHFGYLTLVAKKYGVETCDWIAGDIKETETEEKDRIKYFHAKIAKL